MWLNTVESLNAIIYPILIVNIITNENLTNTIHFQHDESKSPTHALVCYLESSLSMEIICNPCLKSRSSRFFWLTTGVEHKEQSVI